MSDISNIVVSLFAIATAISVHEFGHAYSAHLLGDDTAKMYGRMTLNPMKHVDPIGALMMVLVHVGWAKPVPINPNNFKSYKWGNFIVSLAGAGANIITAIIWAIITKVVFMYGNIFGSISGEILIIANMVIAYNIGFAAFNLLPIPPLDGWGVVSTFIPLKFNEIVYKYENMGYLILMLSIFTGAYRIIIDPIRNILSSIVMLFL